MVLLRLRAMTTSNSLYALTPFRYHYINADPAFGTCGWLRKKESSAETERSFRSRTTPSAAQQLPRSWNKNSHCGTLMPQIDLCIPLWVSYFAQRVLPMHNDS